MTAKISLSPTPNIAHPPPGLLTAFTRRRQTRESESATPETLGATVFDPFCDVLDFECHRFPTRAYSRARLPGWFLFLFSSETPV